IGNAITIPLFGFMGAAWMTLATEAVVLVQTTRLLVGQLGWDEFGFGRVARTAIAAILLGLVLGSERLADAPLGVVSATACALYPVLLFAFKAVGPDDLRALRRERALT